MENRNKEIAGEILRQLGGNKFIVMTGAKNLAYDESNLTFKIGRNSKSINYVEIKLNGSDLYDMTFSRVSFSRKTGEVKNKIISTAKGIYNDMLQGCFTEATGLYTRL